MPSKKAGFGGLFGCARSRPKSGKKSVSFQSQEPQLQNTHEAKSNSASTLFETYSNIHNADGEYETYSSSEPSLYPASTGDNEHDCYAEAEVIEDEARESRSDIDTVGKYQVKAGGVTEVQKVSAVLPSSVVLPAKPQTPVIPRIKKSSPLVASVSTIPSEYSVPVSIDCGYDKYKVTATPDGGRFYSSELLLSGTIPEEAVTEDSSLTFCRRDPPNQQLAQRKRFISAIYDVLPHGKMFKKQIVLRFPHRSNRNQKFANETPCYRTRRKVYYSPTNMEDNEQWEEIGSEGISNFCRQDIQAIINNEEVCLMLLRFCCFVAVEEQIPTKFVRVEVYGFKSSAETFTVTVVIAAATDACGKRLAPGILLEVADLCLVQDVPDINVWINRVSGKGWNTKEDSKDTKTVLHTYYLWNNKRQQAKFVLQKDDKENEEHLNVDLAVEHDSEIVPIEILMDTQLSPDVNGSSFCYNPHESPVAPRGEECPVTVGAVVDQQYSSKANTWPTLTEQPYADVQKRKTDWAAMALPPIPGRLISTEAKNVQGNVNYTIYSNSQRECQEVSQVHHLKKTKLTHDQKIELSRKLDPVRKLDGKDWRALACKMGYGGWEYTLENDKVGPTRCLLNIWESHDGHKGSVQYLIDMLKGIGRGDAANVIEKEHVWKT